MMAEEKKSTIAEEAGLGPEWQPIDSSPIIPGSPVSPAVNPGSPYIVGALPDSLQHDTYFTKSEYPYQGIPQSPVMPLGPSGSPSLNAAVKSIVENSVVPSTPTTANMRYRGVWLVQTPYSQYDVVEFNFSTYIALNASVGAQPDNNPLNWYVLSENLVFNPTVTSTGNPGFGVSDGSAQEFGTFGNLTVGPLTPSTPGDLALLGLSGNSGALSAGWIDYKIGGNSGLFFIKSLPTAATVSENLGSYAPGQWSTNLLLFQSNGQSIIGNISSIAINGSNLLTVTCANTFLPGTHVVFAGLTTATFLNSQVVTVLSSNGTSFTATFSHASYGPAADTGTANNLMYLQLQSVLNGGHSGATTYTPTFSNNVRKGSLVVIPFVCSDNNATNTFTTVTDSQSNVWTIKNNTGGGGCSMAWAYMSATGPLTVTIVTGGNSAFSAMVMYEYPGGGTTFQYHFVPYDVQQFRGSTYVCLTETTGDAFANPSAWAQLAQGTGYVDVETSSYLATTTDSGRLLSFNSSGAVTLSLPATAPQLATPQSSGWWVAVQNIGAGTLTISPNGLNIDGSASSLTLGQNQGMSIFTDGINYYTSHAVTSVTVPSILTISGPNASGVVAIGLATEAANTGLRGPTTGSAAVPTFRALVNADLPTSAVTPGSYTNTNLTVNAQGIIPAAANGSAALSLEVNGTPNGSQTLLNLIQGSNITITDNGSGGITFAATGGSSGGGVNAQTINYLAVSGDSGKLISMNGSSLTLTLPAAPPSATWFIAVENVASTALTVSRNGLNIDGAALNLSLAQNQGVFIYTDGANYFTSRGMASGGGGSLTLEVNGTLNGSQTLLDLKNGSGISITDDGIGGITIANSATGDALEVNATPVVSPFSFNALVNGVGPVGETEVNSFLVRNNSPCLLEDTGINLSSAMRVFGGVYQNNTGFPLLVMVSVFNTSVGNGVWKALSDASPIPTTVVWESVSGNSAGNTDQTLTFFVLPGQFYTTSVSAGGGGLQAWREFKLVTGTFADSGNISGSRSLSTVFQNTTGKTMFVVAQVSGVSASSSVQGLSDTTPNPTNVIDDSTQTSSGSNTVTVFMPVPAGHYYKVTAASGSLAIWHEYTWTVPMTKSTDLIQTTGYGKTRNGAAFSSAVNTGTTTATAVQPQCWINDSGRVRWVQIISTNSAASVSNLRAGDGIPPWLQASVCGQNSSQPRHTYGPVLPNKVYSFIDFTSGTLTMNHWWEYLLG